MNKTQATKWCQRNLSKLSVGASVLMLIIAAQACGNKRTSSDPTISQVTGAQGQTLDSLSIGMSPTEGGGLTQFAYVVDTTTLSKIKTVKAAALTLNATASSGSNFKVSACIGVLNPTPATTGRELARWPCVPVPFDSDSTGIKRVELTPYLFSFLNDRFTLFLTSGEERQGFNLSRVSGLATLGDPAVAGFQFDTASIKLEIDSTDCETGCVGEAQGCGEFADQASCQAHSEGSSADMGCNFVTRGVCIGKFSGSCYTLDASNECPPRSGLLATRCEVAAGSCVANCGANDPASCGDGAPTRCEAIGDRKLCGGPCEWRDPSCTSRDGADQCGKLSGQECLEAIKADRCVRDPLAGSCRPIDGACQRDFEGGSKTVTIANTQKAVRQQANVFEQCLREELAKNKCTEYDEFCVRRAKTICTCSYIDAYCEGRGQACLDSTKKTCECMRPAAESCQDAACLNDANLKCRGQLQCDSEFCSFETECVDRHRACDQTSVVPQNFDSLTGQSIRQEAVVVTAKSGGGNATQRLACIESRCPGDIQVYSESLKTCATRYSSQTEVLACANAGVAVACSNKCKESFDLQTNDYLLCLDDCYSCVDKCSNDCGLAACESTCSGGEVGAVLPKLKASTRCDDLDPIYCEAEVRKGICEFNQPNSPKQFSCDSIRSIGFPALPAYDTISRNAVQGLCTLACGGTAVSKELANNVVWWVCEGTYQFKDGDGVGVPMDQFCLDYPMWCGRSCKSIPGRGDVKCETTVAAPPPPPKTYIAATPGRQDNPNIQYTTPPTNPAQGAWLDDSCYVREVFPCKDLDSPFLCASSFGCNLTCTGVPRKCSEDDCKKGIDPFCKLGGRCDDKPSACTGNNCDDPYCAQPEAGCKAPDCEKLSDRECASNRTLCQHEPEGCYPREGTGCSAGSGNIEQCLEAGCNYGLPYCTYKRGQRRPTCGSATTQVSCDQNTQYGCDWVDSGCAQRTEFDCSSVPLAQCNATNYPGCRPADTNCPGNTPPLLKDPKCSKSSTDDAAFVCGATYTDRENNAPLSGSTKISFFVGDTPQCGPFETTALQPKALDFAGRGIDLAYSIVIPSEELTECSKGVTVATIRDGKFRYCVNATDNRGAPAPEVCAAVPYEMFAGYGLLPPGCQSTGNEIWTVLGIASALFVWRRRSRRTR